LKGEPESTEIKEIAGIKLIIRDFHESTDVERMVQTANEIVKKDVKTVAVFYGSDGKNARIMVMAGDAATGKGVDASEIVREASAIVGGGGGGRPNFAQGGGTRTDRLLDAVKKAEEIVRKRLEP
jgi:alanyl-tRNA synthetase